MYNTERNTQKQPVVAFFLGMTPTGKKTFKTVNPDSGLGFQNETPAVIQYIPKKEIEGEIPPIEEI